MPDDVPVYSKQALIAQLKAIAVRGWIANARRGNHGGIGNTLEDLLGLKENNLPIPNAAEWELKAQRLGSSSLTTLFHFEPSPRALRFVPQILLPKYGWPQEEAGTRYPVGERSFRQTIHGQARSDRGFMVVIDRAQQKVLVSFDAGSVQPRTASGWRQYGRGSASASSTRSPTGGSPIWSTKPAPSCSTRSMCKQR